jgi:hypothetical protein
VSEPQSIRGKWALPRKKRGRDLKPHLMSSEGKTFCGRQMKCGEIMDPAWNPEDHLDKVCPVCLEWWHLTTPKHPEPLPPST